MVRTSTIYLIFIRLNWDVDESSRTKKKKNGKENEMSTGQGSMWHKYRVGNVFNLVFVSVMYVFVYCEGSSHFVFACKM